MDKNVAENTHNKVLSNVYCDNNLLKKRILQHSPIVGNLFHHEVAMLMPKTIMSSMQAKPMNR